DDRRTSREVTTDDTDIDSVQERYAYDGSDLALVFNSSNQITDRFLTGPDGQVLADDKGNDGVEWYLNDHQGSVRKVINGSSTTTYDYDAFGNTTSTAVPERFGYTGQERDAETQLYYYGARYVDTLVGGFINQDPAKWGSNLYAYVGNNPVNL